MRLRRTVKRRTEEDEEEGEDEEQRLLVLGLPPTPSLATAPSSLVCSLLLLTPKYSSWRLKDQCYFQC